MRKSIDFPYIDGIFGEESGEAATAILDGELCVILLVRARLGAVILVVQHCRHTHPAHGPSVCLSRDLETGAPTPKTRAKTAH